MDLGPNIARNQALKENVFMMVICIELRIPLFLVGKPGSSKSLAKTIVADAMQGEAARTRIFRLLKSVRRTSLIILRLVFRLMKNTSCGRSTVRVFCRDILELLLRFVHIALGLQCCDDDWVMVVATVSNTFALV